MRKYLFKRPLLFFVFLNLSHFAFSQKKDSTKVVNYFGGAVTVTTKGISTIPNFTLGKPAVIFDLSMGKRKLYFEPQCRFSLAGKPWTFLFWWRYKLLKTDKLQINLGAHPAIAFRTRSVITDGVSNETIFAERYLAGELSQNYFLARNIGIGMYYLYSRGLEKNITRNTHFISLRTNFSNIKLSDNYFMRFNPQVYYLKQDENDGFYFNSTLILARRNFPVSVSSLINNPVHTSLQGGKNFLWNVSLIYTFNKEYVEN